MEFKGGNLKFLSQLGYNPLGDWQVEMADEDISFDCHFFGFTQLYATTPRHPITAKYHLPLTYATLMLIQLRSIIAIIGLDGHTYESWRGKGNLGHMWLHNFLLKDLPHYQMMIYSYNSKLSSYGDTIMDYRREFLEGIKRVRYI